MDSNVLNCRVLRPNHAAFLDGELSYDPELKIFCIIFITKYIFYSYFIYVCDRYYCRLLSWTFNSILKKRPLSALSEMQADNIKVLKRMFEWRNYLRHALIFLSKI